jgi:hypothetical protein
MVGTQHMARDIATQGYVYVCMCIDVGGWYRNEETGHDFLT